MINYYLVDFWIGMSQIITLILLVSFFLGWLVIEHHSTLLHNLTILFGIINTIMFVITIIWPYVF